MKKRAHAPRTQARARRLTALGSEPVKVGRPCPIPHITVPDAMRGLRYLKIYTASSHTRIEEEEAHCERLRAMGFDVRGFCVSVPSPGPWWHFARLDAAWRGREASLIETYDRLRDALRDRDVLIAWTGANLHPDFIRTLNTYNVFLCADDPDSSAFLSRPAAPAFDYAFTRNVACVDDYRSWGCDRVKWLMSPLTEDLCDPEMTEERILTEDRDLDIVLFCERDSGISDRPQRIQRLMEAFPQAVVAGRGWPRGFVSRDEIRAAYRRARIGWNLHHSLGPCNTRLMALPAAGVLEICDNKRHLGKALALDQEVVGFETVDECIEKTQYYLEHEEERRRIAAAGFRRATTDYTEPREWARLLSCISETCLAKMASRPSRFVSAPEVPSGRETVRLHLGCGTDHWAGWVNVDRDPSSKADVVLEIQEIGSRFEAGSVSEIAMVHSLN